ncbi:hypothetical protein J2W56_005978 [Nocardia kruczakiae]|uniref:DUF7701 domain-containing protein n=1 Tax=Nocardia kruczakiae TaxID=261477 RepID=A0ABU1XQR7_9NOCA|nr:hypothetical protein [Nocardia kruczakiae]MDR7172217.1 hypothetical protein [Nocardia kruczakiae]
MTTYLERDADLIKQCLPEGTDAPEGSDDLFLMYAVLLRAKGADTQASDVHDAWSAWMIGIDPAHESIRPFADLDAETRGEDSAFLVAIRAAAQRRAQQSGIRRPD